MGWGDILNADELVDEVEEVEELPYGGEAKHAEHEDVLRFGEWTGREVICEGLNDDVGGWEFVLLWWLTKFIVSPVKSEWGEMMMGRLWLSPPPFCLFGRPRLPTGLEHETKPSSVLDEVRATLIFVFKPTSVDQRVMSIRLVVGTLRVQLGWIRLKFGSKYIPDGIMFPEVLAVPDWWDEELAVWHLDEVDEDADAESKRVYKMNELNKIYTF